MFARPASVVLVLFAVAAAAEADLPALPSEMQPKLRGEPAPTGRVFVLIHGMSGDPNAARHTGLADAVRGAFPGASVVVVDWSAAARPELVGFLPNPASVARRIDAVAASAAKTLVERGVAGDRVTIIGESFGVYVGAGIAQRLGGVERIVALNAANRLGGYAPTDLTRVAASSFSLVTRSALDTRQSIAGENRVIVCPPEMNPIERHAIGVRLATERLAAGDRRWFNASPLDQLAIADPSSRSASAL